MILLSLPVELLINVFETLDPQSLLKFRIVSKLLYKIFNDTPRLQYNLELALSGMQHNRACDLPLHESLVAIRAYRTAWDTLNWSRSEKLTPPYPETQVVGGLITYINESAEIPLRTVRQVPSTLRSIQSQHWSFPSRNTPAGGYVLAIDVIQDLVVWSEVIVSNAPLDIRVRTLSSNQPYFGVEVPVLIIPGGPGLSSVFEVDIVGSYLAVSGCCPAQAGENGGVILVCNWKQQQVTLRLEEAFSYFAFLDDRRIIVASSRDGNQLYLVVYDFQVLQNTPVPICFFNLPPTRQSHSAQFLPEGPWCTKSPCWNSTKDQTIPFYPNQADKILKITFTPTSNARRSIGTYSLIFPVSTILQHLPRSGGNEQAVIPWESWGPDGSRFLQNPLGISSVYGLRLVTPVHIRRGAHLAVGVKALQVYDFNQAAIPPIYSVSEAPDVDPNPGPWGPWPQSTDMESYGVMRLISAPTVIPGDDVFEQDIVTNLPYRVATHPLEYGTILRQLEFGEDFVLMVDVR